MEAKCKIPFTRGVRGSGFEESSFEPRTANFEPSLAAGMLYFRQCHCSVPAYDEPHGALSASPPDRHGGSPPYMSAEVWRTIAGLAVLALIVFLNAYFVATEY